MAFWGCVLKPGQKKPVKLGSSEVLHLSQACLHDPKPGKNYLQVEVEGTTYSIACLEKDKRDHDSLDLFFEANASFVAKGTSEIHLMGYIEPSDDMMPEESEEEGEEQQIVPKLASPKAVPVASPKAAATSSPKVTALAGDSDEDFLEEGEESEEEGSEQQTLPVVRSRTVASSQVSPKASPQAKVAAADSDSDEGLSMGDEEGEESEEEGAGQQTLAPQSSPKRKAADEPQGAPVKKSRSQGPDPHAADKEAYTQKLLAYLKEKGKTNVGTLGSKVPRPSGVPKLKVFFEQNKDKFNVVGDMVTPR